MGDTYMNLRSELWFKAKAFLEERSCKFLKMITYLSLRLCVIVLRLVKMKAESKDECVSVAWAPRI